MSKAMPWGVKPQSFTGTDSYAYSYARHSYSRQSYAANGGAGPAESPMLSIGIANTRSDLVSGLLSPDIGTDNDVGGAVQWPSLDTTDALPGMNRPETLRQWAPDVQAALAEFQVLSQLRFRAPEEKGLRSAGIYHIAFAADGGGAERTLAEAKPIATVTRPDQDFFLAQLKLVESWASSRETRGPEILTQIDPPMGYFASLANLHADRTPKTLRLIGLAQHIAFMVGMQFKHALACPRPIEYSALIQPMIETPAHATMPAGHALESFMAVGVIEALVPGFARGKRPNQALRRLAHRIAQNRVVAGLHFPIDCVAGELMGTALAEYFVAMCQPDKSWVHREFAVDPKKAAQLGSRDHLADVALAAQVGCYEGKPFSDTQLPNPILEQLWKGASQEWVNVPKS